MSLSKKKVIRNSKHAGKGSREQESGENKSPSHNLI
jgi:hypothetical protein